MLAARFTLAFVITLLPLMQSHEEREMIAQHEGLRKGLIGCLGSLMLDSSLFTDLCRIRIPHTLRELALCDWVHPRDRMAALRAVDFVAVSLCQHEEVSSDHMASMPLMKGFGLQLCRGVS